jgi:putative acetyltransferase
MKVCIGATDPRLLLDHVYWLSLREDCVGVKVSRFERDGMVLARVWLRTDHAAAELCELLKGHPRLLVTLQDDAYFDPFRAPPLGPGQYGVFEEFVDDAAAVAEVQRAAFGRPDEAAMIDAVRASRVPVLSLVALTRSDDRGAFSVAGHVLLSPVTIEGRGEPPGLGLAPLAVLPEHQRRGVGTLLVQAALSRARLLGLAYVVVLGHPRYYTRFGFVPASRLGLRYDQPVPDEAFMAIELREGGLAGVSGTLRYQPAFS